MLLENFNYKPKILLEEIEIGTKKLIDALIYVNIIAFKNKVKRGDILDINFDIEYEYSFSLFKNIYDNKKYLSNVLEMNDDEIYDYIYNNMGIYRNERYDSNDKESKYVLDINEEDGRLSHYLARYIIQITPEKIEKILDKLLENSETIKHKIFVEDRDFNINKRNIFFNVFPTNQFLYYTKGMNGERLYLTFDSSTHKSDTDYEINKIKFSGLFIDQDDDIFFSNDKRINKKGTVTEFEYNDQKVHFVYVIDASDKKMLLWSNDRYRDNDFERIKNVLYISDYDVNNIKVYKTEDDVSSFKVLSNTTYDFNIPLYEDFTDESEKIKNIDLGEVLEEKIYKETPEEDIEKKPQVPEPDKKDKQPKKADLSHFEQFEQFFKNIFFDGNKLNKDMSVLVDDQSNKEEFIKDYMISKYNVPEYLFDLNEVKNIISNYLYLLDNDVVEPENKQKKKVQKPTNKVDLIKSIIKNKTQQSEPSKEPSKNVDIVKKIKDKKAKSNKNENPITIKLAKLLKEIGSVGSISHSKDFIKSKDNIKEYYDEMSGSLLDIDDKLIESIAGDITFSEPKKLTVYIIKLFIALNKEELKSVFRHYIDSPVDFKKSFDYYGVTVELPLPVLKDEISFIVDYAENITDLVFEYVGE